jgi:CHAD domain-containing protein
LAAATPSSVVKQETGSPVEVWSRLEQLLRNRLRKCLALLPKVLGEDDADPVHDLRVWSRRLQQVIITLFPDAQDSDAREMVRVLRRARRSLGGWRDCDVVIAMLDRKLSRVRNIDERCGWEIVREFVRNSRLRQMNRARSQIANRKLFTLAQRGRKLIEQRSEADDTTKRDPIAALISSVSAAYAQWQEGRSKALSNFTPSELHAFRIQTKRLRYRIELLRDVGSPTAPAALASLKTLQDGLGHWHDCVELARITAQALGNPQFLVNYPRSAAAILRKIDRESGRHLKRIQQLLRNQQLGGAVSSPCDSIAQCCGQVTPSGGQQSEAVVA